MERLINMKKTLHHHKPSVDPRPLPTFQDVMHMTRLEKEILNTPQSEFAPTDIHVGAIILGPDRFHEIRQWAGNISMHMPFEKPEDQVPIPPDEFVIDNGQPDEIMPEDSATKCDRDHDFQLDEWEVESFVKRTPDFNKNTGLPNLNESNLWRLNNRPYYNPALLNRATPHDIAHFNSFHFDPHTHRRNFCRRCARRAHSRDPERNPRY